MRFKLKPKDFYARQGARSSSAAATRQLDREAK